MLEIKSMIKNFKLKDLFWITPIILSVIAASLSLPAAPKVYLYQFYQFQSIIIFLSSVWFSWHLYEKKLYPQMLVMIGVAIFFILGLPLKVPLIHIMAIPIFYINKHTV